jgi:hypothetical protein
MMCVKVRRPELICFRDVLRLLSLERWLCLLHGTMRNRMRMDVTKEINETAGQ